MELNQTGPRCVRCPAGHRSWSPVVFSAHQCHHVRHCVFADDCVCYPEIKDIEDILKLQKDIDRLGF